MSAERDIVGLGGMSSLSKAILEKPSRIVESNLIG